MLVSLALIIFCGYFLSGVMVKMRLPSILGMILCGILLGPHCLNLIDTPILENSGDLRQIALAIILLRAGLALNINDLKKIGGSVILLGFLPATLEMLAILFLAPLLWGISYGEAAVMGAVLAAVSPAVIMPRMLKLMDEGYGKARNIPQRILVSASIDDVYIMVLFFFLVDLYRAQELNFTGLLRLPVSIITGLVLGVLSGNLLVRLFKKYHVRNTTKAFLTMGMAFFVLSLQNILGAYIAISGLLSVVSIGITIGNKSKVIASSLSVKFSKAWILAELFLFVLLGAEIDINSVGSAGVSVILLILMAFAMRIAGVYISLIGSKLNAGERLFTAVSFLPKATVQATLGALPLSMGISSGNLILTAAVLCIVIAAPLGALCIDCTYRKLLYKDSVQCSSGPP